MLCLCYQEPPVAFSPKGLIPMENLIHLSSMRLPLRYQLVLEWVSAGAEPNLDQTEMLSCLPWAVKCYN